MGNLSRGLAIASAFVLLGIGATLGARVGNAAASPQSELLPWALADAVPRVRRAVRELTASSTSDLGVPDDVAALEPSIDADGSGPESELRAVPRGNTSPANTSAEAGFGLQATNPAGQVSSSQLGVSALTRSDGP